jgi:hypothetical protein
MGGYVHGGHVRGQVWRIDEKPRRGAPFHHWGIRVTVKGEGVLSDNGYGTAEEAIRACSALVWAVRSAWSYGFGRKGVRAS